MKFYNFCRGNSPVTGLAAKGKQVVVENFYGFFLKNIINSTTLIDGAQWQLVLICNA
jgi:hypothetical protein